MVSKAPLSSDPESSKGVQTPRVDVERFRAELREHGVEEVMGALLSTFVQDAPGRFADLEHAVRGGNAKDIESAAHAFKSGAGTIRATILSDGLGEAEAAGRTGNLESITGLLEQIRGEYLGVVRELEATLSQMPTGG
jgi:HPt (histidine-containing phosphotransfer) domain-containing protein